MSRKMLTRINMKIELVMLLLTSIMFVVLASWNVNIMYRLSNASKQYDDKQAFADSCHLSEKYVDVGKSTSTIVLIVAVLMLFTSFATIYFNK